MRPSWCKRMRIGCVYSSSAWLIDALQQPQWSSMSRCSRLKRIVHACLHSRGGGWLTPAIVQLVANTFLQTTRLIQKLAIHKRAAVILATSI
ncbi:hypothetical protein BU26DRAFT_242682 [Trematosphaeria pertusa]|uniref:Uncharacterized protein n=1 Tax=Trematosphaeria pertusa TaxID=390896 RepID=A0A6A6IQG4_9PLEO|nr:uncharacterized protein BU26DRAFT_242682 [Trematosphaeria pertusa]KAF2251753.1 hypothetical protein BU26DRAFT_242682 [Trematosphaeria pertusa]